MNCKVPTAVLIVLLLASRLYLQPIYSLISDCDETFNYWEPLNLLVRGFGKQTWEYSPEYSIRSWAFLSPLYVLLYPFNKYLVAHNLPSSWNFYLIRIFLGLVSVVLEIKAYREIRRTLNGQVANIWLFFQIFNPGWFHASVELLPSTLAMVLYLGSIKHTLRYLSTKSTPNFVASLTFNFLSSILGWPFVLVLSLPLCFQYLFTHRIITTIRTVFDSSLVIVLLTAIVIGIDSAFYGKITPVSWNILSYNVLNTTEESGPNIFGVEPWNYYIQNLILNFPIPVLFFAIIGVFHRSLWTLWLSLVLWIAIFTKQPHKEERFMYPIYSVITLSASIGLYNVLKTVKKLRINNIKCITKSLKWLTILLTALQAISRTIALTKNYTAPLKLFDQYNRIASNKDSLTNICMGREWYHYPNSFFLPSTSRLRFVRSGFDGLLPGDFAETGSLFQNIREIPKGMNNMNKFDPEKLVPIDECQYVIDITLPVDLEKDTFDPINQNAEWNEIACRKFVDIDNSRIIGRTFYIPDYLVASLRKYLPSGLNSYLDAVYNAEYVDYCLYERAHIDTNDSAESNDK
ncbi:dolichyl-P-Man:Man(6)GlcNAc(2)-PP-dolichol alpha-1,2-mannosyltransferase NDAI_0F03720 [Naumovozyma dairenensis CBS 421]|uniref:Mannosyltransferase n=1 Tax=Naumovozyma dairenensis (strain ATCC 10597 / BCRC 20456 / CBS 421 / NBRC 0211 / NRRL Y-12639) TaxID=1071378 RepID=G0WD29_NAUDC|nr:hypothetical protein NDAI_0F03720 [Naumovozyma dairenensis CBS 421]CCD25690.1 hypothetical protein NDAI_0F03720 [Naumovozyma dairenensis CBS 421]